MTQYALLKAREVLDLADSWVTSSPHGENCYLSDHYDGDPGSGCNCGKEGVLQNIDDSLADLERAIAEDGWRPIELAPFDGTEIWAFNGEQARMKFVHGDCYALWIWADEVLADVDPAPEQPTYFRHLPAPPIATENASQEVG